MRRNLKGSPGAGIFADVVADGGWLFVAGQVARDDPDMAARPLPEFEEEVRICIDRVRRALAMAGASLRDVVQVRVYLSDIDDFEAMNRVYRRYFGLVRPARTTIQLPRLVADCRVEIDAVARCRRQRPVRRRT